MHSFPYTNDFKASRFLKQYEKLFIGSLVLPIYDAYFYQHYANLCYV